MKSILISLFIILLSASLHSQRANITYSQVQKDVNYHHYKIELSEIISEEIFQKFYENLINTGYFLRIEWQEKTLVVTADKLLSENILRDELKFLKISFLNIIDNYSVELH